MKNVFLLILFLIKATLICSSSPSIIELNKENYLDTIEKSDTILILFYDNSCAKCKKYENVIKEAIQRLIGEKLSSNLKESKIGTEILDKVTFAKLDGYKYKDIAAELDIENFPSVKFIRPKFNITNELTNIIDINTLSSQHIINYLKKRIIRQWEEVKTIQELKEINRQNSINLLLCDIGDKNINKSISNIIINLIVYYDDVFLSYVSSLANYSLIEYLNCIKDSHLIILYKHFDEKDVRLSIDPLNLNIEKEIDNFLSTYTTPFIIPMDYDNLQLILQKAVPTLIYLYKNENELNYEMYQNFYSNAKNYRRQILFLKQAMSIDNKNNEFFYLLNEMFELEESSLPTVLALKMTEDELLKFIIEKNKKLTKENLKEFIEGFEKGNLQKFRLSEKLNFTNPFYQNKEGGCINKIVTDNFEKEVIEITKEDKNCFLLYPYIHKINPDIKIILFNISNKIEKVYGIKNVKIGITDLAINEINELREVDKFHLYCNDSVKILEEKFSIRKVINFLGENNCIENYNTRNLLFSDEDEVVDKLEDHFENSEDPITYGYNERIIKEQVKEINQDANNKNNHKIENEDESIVEKNDKFGVKILKHEKEEQREKPISQINSHAEKDTNEIQDVIVKTDFKPDL